MDTRVAIFNWGEISIHTYYLAEQFQKNGISTDIYLYTPRYVDKHFSVKTLVRNLRNKKINVIQIKCTHFEARLIKLNKIAQLFQHPVPALYTNIFLPFKTRKLFKSENYKYLITVAQHSLYWLYKTNANALNKTIHYSLEIEKITDPNIKKHWNLFAMIKEEAKLLKRVYGLIIQDELRLNSFLSGKEIRKDIHVFYLPVSIPGNLIKDSNDYLYKKLGLQSGQKILLYLGTMYNERKIDEVIQSFSNINRDWVLVLHGAGTFPQPAVVNVKLTSLFLEFDDLHLIVCPATIGIAFYDTGWDNTRLTAFSSEKIARYLQCGVPFIAFKNESYIKLKNEFNCCELIDDMEELKIAMDIIMNNYGTYKTNCYMAYNKYYKIENSVKPLVQFILDKDDNNSIP